MLSFSVQLRLLTKTIKKNKKNKKKIIWQQWKTKNKNGKNQGKEHKNQRKSRKTKDNRENLRKPKENPNKYLNNEGENVEITDIQDHFHIQDISASGYEPYLTHPV